MATNPNEKPKPKFNPTEELKTPTLSPELQPLSEITTEIAGTKKESGIKTAIHRTIVDKTIAYQELAGDNVRLVEKMTPEKMFALAKFSDEKIAGFQTLTESQKQNILKYFAEGYNPNLTIKQIKKLANNLYYFYFNKNEKLKVIDNGNLDIINPTPLEVTGKSIEEILTTRGTQFSDEGREIDKLRDQMLDKNIRKNQELNLLLKKLLNN